MILRVFTALFLFPLVAWAQLKFVENKNQWAAGVDFQARVPGGDLMVSSKGFSIYLIDQERLEHDHLNKHMQIDESNARSHDEPMQGHYFQINFLGGQPSRAVPTNALEGYYNFFLGTDSCRWVSHAMAYAEITYPEIYSGIDVKVASLGRNLKYDFVVQAGADATQIQLDYCGLNGLEKAAGRLNLKTALGTLTEQKPVSYQIINNQRVPVASEFLLNGSVVEFLFPEGYDECFDLIIDPLLIFSTYSGSLADNWGSTATPGEHGTVYSSGVTNHWINTTIEAKPFPATPGAFQTAYGGNFDIGIIKYDSAGTRFLYASYLGGNNNETPHSLVVDKSTNDLLVLGTTSSSNYPTTTGAFDRTFGFGQGQDTNVISYGNGSDIVITRIRPDGSHLIASTFVGGNLNDGLNIHPTQGSELVRNYGDEMRGDIITDAAGNVFIASVTTSTNFPVTAGFGNTYHGGASDAVVMKLTPNLSGILWSAFLGGFGFDAAYSIKFDADQNIVVAGGTTSFNFPVTPGAYQTVFGGITDGWIARIAADGSQILQATFTGTIAFDQVYFIDLNATGEVFCYGQTAGAMPVTAGVYNNANSGQFLQKFTSDLSTLGFSTVFGSGIGIPNISPTAFLVNECDNIFMSGWGGDVNRFGNDFNVADYWFSTTENMPVTADALQQTTHGSDFYFMVLSSDASELVYATYLGGSVSKTHVDGGTSRFDKFGIVYHAVCAGCAAGNDTGGPTSDFPTTPGSKSRVNASKNCNNAAFKFDLSSLHARFRTNNVAFTIPDFDRACYPDTIRFQNFSIGGETYEWNFGDGTSIIKPKSDTASLLHQYQAEGIYTVRLIAQDDNTCSVADTIKRVVNYFKDVIEIGEGAVLCEGESFQLRASGGTDYRWTTDNNSFQSTMASPTVLPEDSTVYYITVTDSDGCVKMDSLHVDVISKVELKWDWKFLTDCVARPVISVQNTTTVAENEMVYFDFGDGYTTDELNVTHTYETDGLYTIKIIGVHETCANEERVDLPVYTMLLPNVFTPENSPGFNDQFVVAFGDAGSTPADVGLNVSVTVVDRWGKKVFESTDYKNTWNAANVDGGVYYITLKIRELATCKTWLHIVK
jgi:CHU_C Type IX secretion signal domain/PKD domain